jgi:putative transcriptional regulator
MILHHPSETTLLACGTGTLPTAHVRVVAAHAARCAACAAALLEAEAIGGALLDALAPEPLAPDALQRALARLDAPPRRNDPPRSTIEALIGSGRWRWTAPGIAMINLIRRDASDSRLDLIRVAPGVALLEHGHSAYETTCVLQGAFEDVSGHYHVGDFVEADTGLAHRPTALPGEPCICLIATTGRLRPRGLLGRLVRPLLGL